MPRATPRGGEEEGARSPSPERVAPRAPSRRRPASPPRERAGRVAPRVAVGERVGANLTKSSVSASFLDDTGERLRGRRGGARGLERRARKAKGRTRIGASSGGGEREKRRLRKSPCDDFAAAAPLSAAAELPIPERFVSSGAFMAVTTPATERLTADDARAALAELRATQTSANAAELRRLMERFSDVEENDAAGAASEMADMLTPRGNSEAARNALVARLAQMFRAVIEHRLDLDAREHRGYVPSWRDASRPTEGRTFSAASWENCATNRRRRARQPSRRRSSPAGWFPRGDADAAGRLT